MRAGAAPATPGMSASSKIGQVLMNFDKQNMKNQLSSLRSP